MTNAMEVYQDAMPIEVRQSSELSVADVKDRLRKVHHLMAEEMQKDVDYGVIPGASKKPSLWKPGAEKLCVMFQLGSKAPVLEKTWEGHHLTVIASVTIFHIPTGREIGTGTGMCSTWESKYAWRQAKRKCPACNSESIAKGNPEYGGGFYCNKKIGGCGAKFGDTNADITTQQTGRVPNEDLPDMWNTVIKMAVKRAKIDAALSATGASALFTQDVEDFVEHFQQDSNVEIPPSTPKPQAQRKLEPVQEEGSGDRMVTQSQMKKFFALVNEKNLDQEKVKNWVYGTFGVGSTKSLSLEQASNLIERVNAGEIDGLVKDEEVEEGEAPPQSKAGTAQLFWEAWNASGRTKDEGRKYIVEKSKKNNFAELTPTEWTTLTESI